MSPSSTGMDESEDEYGGAGERWLRVMVNAPRYADERLKRQGRTALVAPYSNAVSTRMVT